MSHEIRKPDSMKEVSQERKRERERYGREKNDWIDRPLIPVWTVLFETRVLFSFSLLCKIRDKTPSV
jgi:hypothetical protein